MTTWSREQVQQVRGLRAAVRLDPVMVERARVDVMRAAREQMVERLTQMAHPFAVELHPADFQFSEAERDEPYPTIEVRAWWEPSTKEIELRGGERDGEVWAVRDAPRERLRVALSSHLSPCMMAGDDDPTELAITTLTYEMTGWSETDRRWVYEPRL